MGGLKGEEKGDAAKPQYRSLRPRCRIVGFTGYRQPENRGRGGKGIITNPFFRTYPSGNAVRTSEKGRGKKGSRDDVLFPYL